MNAARRNTQRLALSMLAIGIVVIGLVAWQATRGDSADRVYLGWWRWGAIAAQDALDRTRTYRVRHGRLPQNTTELAAGDPLFADSSYVSRYGTPAFQSPTGWYRVGDVVIRSVTGEPPSADDIMIVVLPPASMPDRVLAMTANGDLHTIIHGQPSPVNWLSSAGFDWQQSGLR